MSVVLALERRRAHSYALLSLVRQWSGICLATGIRPSMRWLPSEWNPSVEASRRFEQFLDNCGVQAERRQSEEEKL
eukprot:7183643-Heterocapsa_arctica.AAC.1